MSRENLLTLLQLCEDDDERIISRRRLSKWKGLIDLDRFQYYVPADASSALESVGNPINDVDTVMANVFLSHHSETSLNVKDNNLKKKKKRIVVSFAFPEILKSQYQKVELARTHESAAMFLCCCGQEVVGVKGVDKAPSCDCLTNEGSCSRPCMFKQTPTGGLAFHRAVQILQYVRALHPDAHIWLTGFGFNGAMASLLVQYARKHFDDRNMSAVTFHAPGEYWFALRQGLVTGPDPDPDLPIRNVGITSNPVFVKKNAGPTLHNYGFLLYQTFMRAGQDCAITTLGEKRIQYHSIGQLEGVIQHLHKDHQITCTPNRYEDTGRECGHVKYVEKDIPSNYLHVMGGP